MLGQKFFGGGAGVGELFVVGEFADEIQQGGDIAARRGVDDHEGIIAGAGARWEGLARLETYMAWSAIWRASATWPAVLTPAVPTERETAAWSQAALSRERKLGNADCGKSMRRARNSSPPTRAT